MTKSTGLRDLHERERLGQERVRTPIMLKRTRSEIAGSAVTVCMCGGLLAEHRGIVYCLSCEVAP